MINELHELAVSLKEKRISLQEWHREYKLLPKVTGKKPCIRIWIASDGTISDYESVDAKLAQSLRKYGDNQGTFPAFNINSLYRITDANLIFELDKFREDNNTLNVEKVRSWCKEKNNNWKSKTIKKVRRCLQDRPQELLGIINASEQSEKNIISDLAHLTMNFSSIDFRDSLEKCIFSKLQNFEDINISLLLLLHSGDREKEPEKDNGPTISVILDAENWEQYGYPVANEHTTKWLNEKLLAVTPKNEDTAFNDGEDAFGTPFNNPNEPMPNVKLSGFDVTLRSMFKAQYCQYRYGQIEDGTYPIARRNRSLIKTSLEWIAKSEHEGMTWRKIDQKEIVFVYPSKLPEVPVQFASIFGPASSENSSETELRFESVSKKFIKTLNGIPPNERPDRINIFAIRKIDKARSKVIFTHNTSLDQLVSAAEIWKRGCYNLPDMSFGELIIPFPLQIAKIVNIIWKQNGESAQGKAAVSQIKHYQGMELLLDILQKDILEYFLHILVTNSSGLVFYIGNWVHGIEKNKENPTKNLKRLKQYCAQVFSVLGLLLYKCDIQKEDYMENQAYLVGQLLHIVDELHALYCKVVRNGDIPPQLAGSTLFVTAGETPNLAISQLSLRTNPYIAWAKQYRYKKIKKKGEESWKAGWLLRLMETTCDKLTQVISDSTRFNDFEKAQLFIGYMASFPKKEATDTQKDNENIGGSKDE